jgi:DNA modification methylase
MMENCGNIYDVMLKDGYYLYNIGDIVSEDNVYVSSHTSKRRIPLGFLSVLIFEIAGFNTAGNIIWDKGEVQSKRNSTNNLYAGFVKCVNCYEHFWVFKKGINKDVINDVEKITPVIKINSKGINIVKHTAPYPIELVDLAKKYVNNDAYVLDPFLGSGTTLRWCKQNDLKGLGFELNKEYYELCKDNIENV